MKKIIKNIVIILFVSVFISTCNVSRVQADGISDIITGGDNFIQAGKDGFEKSKADGKVIIDEDKLKNVSDYVYNVLLLIGIVVAVIVSSVLGIKFMIGSVEEKAQIKDALVPFVIGCIVVFSAFAIWKIFVTIGNSL